MVFLFPREVHMVNGRGEGEKTVTTEREIQADRVTDRIGTGDGNRG